MIEQTKALHEREDALQANELLLNGILSTSLVAIGLTVNRKIKWMNEAWFRLFEFENEDECVGQSTRILYPSQEEFERVGGLLSRDLGSGTVVETDAKFQRQDGSIFIGHLRIKALDPSDPAKGAISSIVDITERKQAEETLRQSEEKYRLVVQKTHEAILVAQEGMHKFVNPAAIKIWGYSEEELLSRPFTEFIHPDDREMVLERSLRRARGEKIPEPLLAQALDQGWRNKMG